MSELHRIYLYLAASVVKAKAYSLYILNLWLIIFYMH